MPEHDALARALAAALHRLTERADALRAALHGQRRAFVGADAVALAALHETHAAEADRLHAAEREVVACRAALCAALGAPDSVRVPALCARLPGAVAEELDAAATTARAALLALRVESAVGQRLLDATRRAQEGLWQALRGGTPDGQRYDRHARAVGTPDRSGSLLRGTV
ncbi:MAG TPA: hypothetical protein VK081_07485 [Planctomycetota bacterium]|nr:hypothetical protein [Planctomycetota bacterium]